jgi:hypothetical protein
VGLSGGRLVRDALGEGDIWSRTGAAHADALDMLLSGQEKLIEVGPCGVLRGATRGRLVLPGSFNPIHDGHSELLQVSSSLSVGYWAGSCCRAASTPSTTATPSCCRLLYSVREEVELPLVNM